MEIVLHQLVQLHYNIYLVKLLICHWHTHAKLLFPVLNQRKVYTIFNLNVIIINSITVEIRISSVFVDWKVLQLVLKELPQVMQNRALVLSRHTNDIDYFAAALCSMVRYYTYYVLSFKQWHKFIYCLSIGQ